jgi:hypothetical protein
MTNIEVRGLDEIMQRMRAFPRKLESAVRTTMDAALLTLWEKVPPYPDKPSPDSYDRTGTLGRTLGSGMSGGIMGSKPDIYDVKKLGQSFEARFGTTKDYAPYVIGDDDQAWMHRGRWWTMKVIADRARDKVLRLFDLMGEKLAAFLEGLAGGV